MGSRRDILSSRGGRGDPEQSVTRLGATTLKIITSVPLPALSFWWQVILLLALACSFVLLRLAPCRVASLMGFSISGMTGSSGILASVIESLGRFLQYLLSFLGRCSRSFELMLDSRD